MSKSDLELNIKIDSLSMYEYLTFEDSPFNDISSFDNYPSPFGDSYSFDNIPINGISGTSHIEYNNNQCKHNEINSKMESPFGYSCCSPFNMNNNKIFIDIYPFEEISFDNNDSYPFEEISFEELSFDNNDNSSNENKYHTHQKRDPDINIEKIDNKRTKYL